MIPPSFTAASPVLINAVYNRANVTLVVLDNHYRHDRTASPGVGRTATGEQVPVDIARQRSMRGGIVREVDPYDLEASINAAQGGHGISDPPW